MLADNPSFRSAARNSNARACAAIGFAASGMQVGNTWLISLTIATGNLSSKT